MTISSRITELAQAVGEDIKRLTPPKSPHLTYTAGDLTRVDYSDGSYTVLTYTDGDLTRVDATRFGVTTRKTLVYSGGNLVDVTETVL